MIIALRKFKKYNVKIVVNSNIPLDIDGIDKDILKNPTLIRIYN